MCSNKEIKFIEITWSRLVEASKQINKLVPRPKIQNVPRGLCERLIDNDRFYSPKFIDLGHYPYLNMGKAFKCSWTNMYVEQTKQTFLDLCQRIFIHYGELHNLFSEVPSHPTAEYAMEMVMGGCSVLQVLEKSDHPVYEQEQELKISSEDLVKVHQDMLIMRNQIPFKILQLMCTEEARLKKCLHNFLQVHGVTPPKLELVYRAKEKRAEELKVIVQADDRQPDNEDDNPVHLLDYLRRALLMRDLSQMNKEIKVNMRSLRLRKYRIGTIRELKAKGIRVRKDPNVNNYFNPSFSDGKLLLPQLTLDSTTPLMFLNLIAHEMCPDFPNDFSISSFVVFMNSLIDQAEDVKELRSAGILVNYLGNDKEVADLFNMMDKVLMRPEIGKLGYIRDEIQEYLESKSGKIKMLTWMREAYNTYFRSP